MSSAEIGAVIPAEALTEPERAVVDFVRKTNPAEFGHLVLSDELPEIVEDGGDSNA